MCVLSWSITYWRNIYSVFIIRLHIKHTINLSNTALISHYAKDLRVINRTIFVLAKVYKYALNQGFALHKVPSSHW